MNHNENKYLVLLKTILEKGNDRSDRTNIGTKSLFGYHMSFDVSESIPLLTTKKMAWKSIIKELLWFLSGDTSSKTLEKQNVNIWKQNTTREFLDKRLLYTYEEGDIGPLYPFAFRHYNAQYKGCSKSYKGEGFDQWTSLLSSLRNEPYSRRHILTTFNPSVVKDCVLPPCHGIAIQFYVENIENNVLGLKCHVYCRSSDAFLGLPFNITSYSVLLYIVGKLCNMQPLELHMSLGDVHIYKNHLNQVMEQIERPVMPSPKLIVSKRITELEDIRFATIDDFELEDYHPHPPIHAEMAV